MREERDFAEGNKESEGSMMRKGFTLIELLVATAILLVIALCMSKLFHQCSVAWSAGNRKAAGNMTARAALGCMTRDLMMAVAERDYLKDVEMYYGANDITMINLTGYPEKGERAARKIIYKYDSGKIIRQEYDSLLSAYGKFEGTGNEYTMVTNVFNNGLIFYPAQDCDSANPVPPTYVKIRMILNRSDDVSGVGAWSYGYDGLPGTDDDIRTR